MFWASASVAGKFGLQSAEPLVLFTTRFLLAGIILLAYVSFIDKSRLPKGGEWKQLTLFGILNTTLYLGLFVIALQFITPGITSLAIALNPLFISILSAIWMRRRVRLQEWISIAIGIAGVVLTAYPLFATSYATFSGMILLALSMLAYSAGAVYYAAVPWTLSRTTINAWQVFIGGLLLVPFALALHKHENHFDLTFWGSIAWLVIPVSIIAVQLWLRLLKRDAVHASMWLYLCPIFGFLYSNLLLDEPLTIFTYIGTALVMVALYVGQRKSKT
ncbi:DMT family transporter [Pseudochryseolinea flava]|uniref:EamA family transporter n=1 Tax=Pseudochryseolinea flava TaxID=2059302 RepID=A0A364XZZ7_9BACT|nr:DMT family transporter [Pseudochryseolinea flava]RAW00102.1 EamA family transporter [Pseudochryseolinea flava]